jgi:hypothetical protein
MPPVPESKFRAKLFGLVKEKAKVEENKDEKDQGKIDDMILKQNLAEADIKEMIPKVLEIEARNAKFDDEDFKKIFDKMKKAVASTAEAKLVQADEFMKSITEEARAVKFNGKKASLIFDKVPKIKAPCSDDEEEDLPNQIFDFFDGISQGKKDALSDVQLCVAHSHATYNVHRVMLASASKYMLKVF